MRFRKKNASWKDLVKTLRLEAETRGGRLVFISADSFYLSAAREGSLGETITITREDSECCRVKVGIFTETGSDMETTMRYVLNIMDGNATESIGVNAVGNWVDVRFIIGTHKGWQCLSSNERATKTITRNIQGWGTN